MGWDSWRAELCVCVCNVEAEVDVHEKKWTRSGLARCLYIFGVEVSGKRS